MPASLGSVISRSEYNAIQSQIDSVLGTGNGADVGYGRALESSQITTTKVIESEDMLALYNDLVKARQHQKGVSNLAWTNTDGLASPSDDEIIGVFAADVGANPANATEVTSFYASNDLNEGFKDFELAAADIVAGHDLTGPGQLTLSQASQSNRTSQWGGGDVSLPGSSINHTVTVTWTNADERRYFFNSGGEIRFSALFEGSWTNGTKNKVWQQMVDSMGDVVFGKYSTDSDGTNPGTGSSIGNYYAQWSQTSSSNPVTIFTKTGSGVYADNFYTIKAWQPPGVTNSLRFDIIFQDGDLGTGGPAPDTPVDEYVTAEAVSTVNLKTATGALGISAPTVTTNSNLSGGVAGSSSIVIKALQGTTEVTEIDEGQGVTFKIETTNINAGTLIPWAITGITLADITGPLDNGVPTLSGVATLDSSGEATVVVTTLADEQSDGQETITFSLPSNGGVSKSITLNDTSGSVSFVLREQASSMIEGGANGYWLDSGQTELNTETFYWDINTNRPQAFTSIGGTFVYDASENYSASNPAFTVYTQNNEVLDDSFQTTVRVARGGPPSGSGTIIANRQLTINDNTTDALTVMFDTSVTYNADPTVTRITDVDNICAWIESATGNLADVYIRFDTDPTLYPAGATIGDPIEQSGVWYSIASFPLVAKGEVSGNINQEAVWFKNADGWNTTNTASLLRVSFKGAGRIVFGHNSGSTFSDVTAQSTTTYLRTHGGKVTEVLDWGQQFQYTSFRDMFRNCALTDLPSTGNPRQYSTAGDMRGMFAYCGLLTNGGNNNAFPNFNMQGVTRMDDMFSHAYNFTGDVSTWNVSSVTNFNRTFFAANLFNADISNWDVSSALSMTSMFGMYNNAVQYPPNSQGLFNQDIGNWDVANVTNMDGMFLNHVTFNQDLSGWCVTNIASLPTGFTTTASALATTNYPVWGTCPGTIVSPIAMPAGQYYAEPAPDLAVALSVFNLSDPIPGPITATVRAEMVYDAGSASLAPKIDARARDNYTSVVPNFSVYYQNGNYPGTPTPLSGTDWQLMWQETGNTVAPSEIKIKVTEVFQGGFGTVSVNTQNLFFSALTSADRTETNLYGTPTTFDTWISITDFDRAKIVFELSVSDNVAVSAYREFELEFWGRGASRDPSNTATYSETKFATLRIRLSAEAEGIDTFVGSA